MLGTRGVVIGFIGALASAIAMVATLAACDSQPDTPPPATTAATVMPPPPPEPDEPVGPVAEGVIYAALEEPDPFTRAGRLASLLPTLGPADAREAQAALMDSSIDLGGTEVVLLVQFWATHQPRQATAWSLHRSPGAFRAAASIAALEIAAQADPHDALRAVQALLMLPSENGVAAEIALIRGWFDSGQPGLEEYIAGLGPSFSQQRALAIFARRTIQRDGAEAAVRWAEALPDDDAEYKLAAFRQTASELAKLDTPVAAAFCDAHCDGPYGSNVRSLVAQRWADRDGRAAMAWIARAAPSRERDLAVRAAFAGWWRRDREEMKTWLAETERNGGIPAWFQATLPHYATALGREEPEEGLRLAAIVEDEEGRVLALTNIARSWRKFDETAADAWLAHSPLTEEQRESVRNPKPGKERDPDALEDEEDAGDS